MSPARTEAPRPAPLVTANPVRGLDQWRGRPGAVALALIVGVVAGRTWTLASAYFTQDDFLMLSRSVDRPLLSADFLLQDYSGHVFPGGFVMAWLVANPGRMGWPAAYVPVVALLAVAGVLTWMVLCRVVGDSWLRLPLLALVLVCPLALWSTQWWAVAIQFLPVTICSLLAVLLFLVHRQDDNAVAGALVLPVVAAGLLFQERGILAPMLLGLIAVADSDGEGLLGRPLAALRRHAVLWTSTGVLLVLYLMAHRRLAPIDAGSPGDAGDTTEFLTNLVLRNSLTGLWGGPWGLGEVASESLVVPWVLPVVLAVAASAALVVMTTWRRDASALWVWGLFGVVFAVNVAMLFAGRSQLGPAFGLNPRYAADLVLPCALTLALVTGSGHRPASWANERVPLRRRFTPVRALLVSAAYVMGAVITTTAVLPATYNRDDRAYVETLRRGVAAHPSRVLFDSIVPNNIMIGWFGDDARLSTVLAAAPENPVFDAPSSRIYMADPRGVIREAALVATTSARPPEDDGDPCGHHVTSQPSEIVLEDEVDDDRRVLRMGYYSGEPTLMTVSAAGTTQSFPVNPGTGGVDLVVDGAVDRLGVRIVDPGRTVCVTSLVIGSPTPLGS